MSVTEKENSKIKIRLELFLEGDIAEAFEAYRKKEKLQKNAPTAFKLVADGLERAGFFVTNPQETAKAA